MSLPHLKLPLGRLTGGYDGDGTFSHVFSLNTSSNFTCDVEWRTEVDNDPVVR